MKKFYLMVLAMAVMGAGQASALDCKQLATKYIKAAQQEDYKTIVNMVEVYQKNAQNIRASVPKYAQEKQLTELFEGEKERVATLAFPPSAKWNILEIKKSKLSKNIDYCAAYIKTEYPNFSEAPVMRPKYASYTGKKSKSTVVILSFYGKGYISDKPEMDDSMTKYWDEKP